MEGLYTVRHSWWADHQVMWCKSYKISQRHKQKTQSLVLKRDLWFAEMYFFGINFGTDPGIRLDLVSKPSFSLTCPFPQAVQCFLVLSSTSLPSTYSPSFISLLEKIIGQVQLASQNQWKYLKHTMSHCNLCGNSLCSPALFTINQKGSATRDALHAVAEPQQDQQGQLPRAPEPCHRGRVSAGHTPAPAGRRAVPPGPFPSRPSELRVRINKNLGL